MSFNNPNFGQAYFIVLPPTVSSPTDLLKKVTHRHFLDEYFSLHCKMLEESFKIKTTMGASHLIKWTVFNMFAKLAQILYNLYFKINFRGYPAFYMAVINNCDHYFIMWSNWSTGKFLEIWRCSSSVCSLNCFIYIYLIFVNIQLFNPLVIKHLLDLIGE